MGARGDEWVNFPFVLRDEKTLVCKVVSQRRCLYSFWTQFSLDEGASWVHDRVPDGWVVDPPQVDPMRMYTFTSGVSGTVADWWQELSKIKELEFNAVRLLPLTTRDTSLSLYAALR